MVQSPTVTPPGSLWKEQAPGLVRQGGASQNSLSGLGRRLVQGVCAVCRPWWRRLLRSRVQTDGGAAASTGATPNGCNVSAGLGSGNHCKQLGKPAALVDGSARWDAHALVVLALLRLIRIVGQPQLSLVRRDLAVPGPSLLLAYKAASSALAAAVNVY